jgi:hypothetical protein
MDMETISNKLEKKEYKNWDEFELDFEQIFKNSKEFNARGIFIYK